MKTTTKRLQSSISFFLGFIFTTAGIEKLTGLPDIIGPHFLIEELAKHDLKLYGEFIAYSQLIVGFLLLTNRFRTLATIMLLPMLSNILVVTISLNWSGTPYIVGFLTLLNLIILALDFNNYKFIFSNVENNELKEIKIRRLNRFRDYYYIFPLLLILIGAYFGWTELGKQFAKKGFLLVLLSLLFFKIYDVIEKRKAKQKKT